MSFIDWFPRVFGGGGVGLDVGRVVVLGTVVEGRDVGGIVVDDVVVVGNGGGVCRAMGALRNIFPYPRAGRLPVYVSLTEFSKTTSGGTVLL